MDTIEHERLYVQQHVHIAHSFHAVAHTKKNVPTDAMMNIYDEYTTYAWNNANIYFEWFRLFAKRNDKLHC